tara:strand:- start:119 stop:991 length:873 start_codon:yes stop_codon:yes gene_type:complete
LSIEISNPQHDGFEIVLPYNLSIQHTVNSHGWVNLDPWKWDHTSQTLSRIENLGNSISSTISINQKNLNTIVIKSPNLNPESIELIKKIVFRWISAEWNPNKIIELSKYLNNDIFHFLNIGGGRFLRSSTFYEDVCKTILTINTNWASTRRMTSNLVGITNDSSFPHPLDIINTGQKSLKSDLRLGFRSRVIYETTMTCLERKLINENGELIDKSISYEDLLKLRGIGPYAASHIMFLEHDFSRIPIDSSVTSYFLNNLGVKKDDIETIFEPWGIYAFLGYSLGRIVQNQ